jgi:metal-responsive CopG/Arc/MetJ family transcriptional regulator
MKTAVSIPDEVYEEAERLARQFKRSRSEIYSTALAEYLARHMPDRVTDAMDNALSVIEQKPDEFVSAAARQVLASSEW